MITFRDVTKEYPNGTVALCGRAPQPGMPQEKGMNLHIASREFVFVVGASGAGKSTFLKLLLHEEVPTSGSICVGQFELNNLTRKQIPMYRRQLGMVFQDFRLIANMNVYDNIAFAMRVVGARDKVIRERVVYLLQLVGLSHKVHSKPSELSGGEQQRVAIARALANNPDLIIADEPTGNIDPRMSQELLDLFVRLNEAGTTVVMVTHAHDLVRQYNKRIIILENGSVVADGVFRRPEETRRQYA
ncbi:MAG: cell division ATP-binding protein FtsE [Oscillospiraceae bacterium]|jgi:cell division transport system ATP-binding protein|nr:cell division ATP-binding protein FtsE [Oscillospiraceae bacterium]